MATEAIDRLTLEDVQELCEEFNVSAVNYVRRGQIAEELIRRRAWRDIGLSESEFFESGLLRCDKSYAYKLRDAFIFVSEQWSEVKSLDLTVFDNCRKLLTLDDFPATEYECRRLMADGRQSEAWHRVFNIWNFSKPDPRFGTDEYPGRMPGQVMQNLLWYYTDEGDLVVDPMAGGGTTLDVCKDMKRRCLAYDIEPCRDDIAKANIVTDGYDSACEGAKLVMLDPPYWSQKKGDYSQLDGQLADLPLAGFYQCMYDIFDSTLEILEPGGYMAVIISDSRVAGERSDHAINFAHILKKADWIPLERVIVPYSTQQVSAAEVSQAREQKRMLRLYRDLLIYGKAA